MIISALLSLFYLLLSTLLSGIDIPDLPEQAQTILFDPSSGALARLHDGLGIFAAYTHFSYLATLFGIVLVIDAAMLGYKFVIWIIKKIPMGGMS